MRFLLNRLPSALLSKKAWQICCKTFLLLSFMLPLMVNAQDFCSNAVALCVNNTVAATTLNATTSGGDPVLGCGDATLNNNVWFTVTGVRNGNCTITVNKIDSNPGLAMQVFSGACGSLTPVAGACNAANGPNGSMNVSFIVTNGTTYYIMVDGQSGNQEAFNIVATTPDNAILGRPQPGFIPTSISSCPPLADSMMRYTTILNGGSNITYKWQIDGGGYFFASANDTTFLFSTTGTHTVDLQICNNECGCAAATQQIQVNSFIVSITPPSNICLGSSVNFSGQAVYQPSGASANIDVSQWSWNFGDPASGPNNTASGQNVSHTFVGAGPNFTVTLIASNQNSDCKSDTVTVVVSTHPKPIVSAGPNQVGCEFNSTTVTATTSNATAPIAYTWTAKDSLSCNNCQVTNVLNLQSANSPDTIRIHIQDANGCTADSSMILVITPKPKVKACCDNTVCKYTPVQLSNTISQGTGPFKYLWTPSAGLDKDTITNPIAIVSSSTQYCLRIRDVIDCPSDTSCVHVNIFSSAAIIGFPKVLCASDTAHSSLFFVTGAGQPGSTYQWYLSPDYPKIDSASADSATIRATFPQFTPGTYNFTCIVTDGITHCVDTITLAYQVVAGLNMTLSSTPSTTICQGDSVTLSASGALTYAWTASPSYTFADSTLSTQIVKPSVTTTYSVAGHIGGCPDFKSVTINVNSKPVVAVVSNAIICPKYPTQIFANVDTNTAKKPYTYSWTPPAGLDNATIYNPTAIITSTKTYCALVTDANNCKADTHCVTLTVYPPLNMISSSDSSCATNPFIQSTFTVTGATSASYNWSLSPDFSQIVSYSPDSSSATAVFPQNIIKTYQFSVIVKDGTGCIDTLSKSFKVYNGLNMTVTGKKSICTGQSTTLTANGAILYSWTASPAYPFADSTKAVQTIIPSTTTAFTIAGTNGTCGQVILDTVVVNSKPTATAGPIPLFCKCDTVHLNGSSVGGNSYNWISLGGNTIFNSNKDSASSFLCQNDFFQLIVTDTITSCRDTASVAANQKSNPAATAAIFPDTICPGTPGVILLDGTGSDTNAGTTYAWTSNNPNAIFADSTQLSPLVTVDSATTFFLTVKDSAGCDSTFAVVLNQFPKLTVSAGADQVICFGDTAHLVATPSHLPVFYQWNNGLFYDANRDSTDACFTASGIYNIDVQVTDDNGCQAQSTVNITVNDGPSVTVISDQTVCAYSPVQLSCSPTPPGYSYLWTPAYGLNDSSIYNPIATVASGTDYCVVVTDSNGCKSSTACVHISLFPKPTISASPAALCFSDSIRITRLTVASDTGSTYSWILSPDYNRIDSASTDSSVVRASFPKVAGSYIFTCIVHDVVTGCTDTVSQTYDVISGVNITITGPSKVCSGDYVTLSASGNAITYAWTATPTYSFADSTLANQTVSPSLTTTFTVLGTTGGCSQTVSTTLVVDPKPSAVPASILAFCKCATVTLDGSGSTPGMNYQWISAGNNPIDFPNQQSATSNLCATDSFQLIVTDVSNGCADTSVVVANQSPTPVAVIASITPNLICPGVPTSITLDGTGSDPLSSYQWSSDNTTTIFSNPTLLNSTATTTNATVFYLTVINGAGCDSTVSDTVRVHPLPSANAFFPFICFSDAVKQSTITVTVANPGSTYTWDTIPSCVTPTSATGFSQTFDFSSCAGLGTYPFYITVNDAVTGCINQVDTSVTIISGVPLTFQHSGIRSLEFT